MGNTNFPGSRRGTGNARANNSDASKEHDNRGASEFTMILLKHIPGRQRVRKMASSDRFKKTEHTHFRTLLYVHYKLSSEYHQKRRSAGCILSCTDPSRQQKVPPICIKEQSLSVPSMYFLRSEHSLWRILASLAFHHSVIGQKSARARVSLFYSLQAKHKFQLKNL